MIIPTAFLLYLEFKNNIGNSCKLYKDFESGNKRLEHEELFGIATNIIHIESGINRFNEILINNSYYDDRISKYDKWKKDLSFIKSNNYKPQNCNLFCPHSGICNHGTNILSTVKPKMERISNYNPIFHSREKVENDVRYAIFKAYANSDKMVNIVKAQTSSGKTTSYLKLMEENLFDRFLIAVPTNILKNEVYYKAIEAGINVMKTSSLEEIRNCSELSPTISIQKSLIFVTLTSM